MEVTEDVPEILEAVGGAESGAATAAMRESKLYAYPLTAGNGYFLYYNKAYFSEEDVKSLDRILEIVAANEKKFSMDITCVRLTMHLEKYKVSLEEEVYIRRC